LFLIFISQWNSDKLSSNIALSYHHFESFLNFKSVLPLLTLL